jgi:hypothetical protein
VQGGQRRRELAHAVAVELLVRDLDGVDVEGPGDVGGVVVEAETPGIGADVGLVAQVAL